MDKAAIAHEVAKALALLEEELRSFAANAAAGTWRNAMKNLCYAAFHAAEAILQSRGIEPKSHEAAQSLLALHFVKAGALPADTVKRLNNLMNARHAADYRGDVPFDATDAREHFPWVCRFVRQAVDIVRQAPVKTDLRVVDRALNQFERVKLD